MSFVVRFSKKPQVPAKGRVALRYMPLPDTRAAQ
jgi:hypothetical protein